MLTGRSNIEFSINWQSENEDCQNILYNYIYIQRKAQEYKNNPYFSKCVLDIAFIHQLSYTFKKELLTYQTCLEIYNDPEVIPCLHSFSTECICNFTKNGLTNIHPCPICREKFELFVRNILLNSSLQQKKQRYNVRSSD